jgi:CPA2 family monovalent cation:H+ antiporter-2
MASAEAALLVEIPITMAAVALVLLLFRRVRQPMVIGYIIAGALIGPIVPTGLALGGVPLVDLLTDMAIVVVMFCVGLTFNLSRLRGTGLASAFTGVLAIAGMMVTGLAVGLALGWSQVDSLFLGAMVAMSSTAVVTSGILERRAEGERSSRIVAGILVIEDLVAVFLLTTMAGFSVTGEVELIGLVATIANIAILVLLLLALAYLVAPRLAAYAASSGSREVYLLTALGLCFTFALLANVVGFSMAIGAFVAGAVLGGCPDRARFEREVRPVKEVALAIFFASIGMLFAPGVALGYWLPIAAIAGLFLCAKPALTFIGARTFGVEGRTALKAGLTMMAMGEFSYIIARQGCEAGVISGFLYPVIVVASVLTILVGTYVNMHQEAVMSSIARRAPRPTKAAAAVASLLLHKL